MRFPNKLKSGKSNPEAKFMRDNLLTKLTMFVYSRLKLTAVLLLSMVIAGAFIYTNVIKREGFPAVQFPISFATGTYFVNDVSRVDAEIAKPVAENLKDFEGLEEIQTTAQDNFYSLIFWFDESVNAADATQQIKNRIAGQNLLPAEATISYTVVDPASFLFEYDLLLSVYSQNNASAAELEEAGQYAAEQFKAKDGISNAVIVPQIATATNPVTGQQQSMQTNFNRIGLRDDGGDLQFYPSVTVGVDKTDDIDILELSRIASQTAAAIDLSQFGEGFNVAVGADQGASINTQVNSLQSNLLTGLIAVAAVSLLLITWRASIITAIFMLSVVLVSVLALFVLGYTLNTITLFALVLALGLFVDDATIVVEAIDANRRRGQRARSVVKAAIRKVAAASFAGTMTTVLVFAPLAFVSGILGEFIRLLPITVIVALITSLALSLTLIPFLSRFILLRSDHISWITRINPISRLERELGRLIGDTIRSVSKNRTRKILIPAGAFLISAAMIVLAGSLAGKLGFNIFPSTKDSDQIGFTVSFARGTDIAEAQAITGTINQVTTETIGTHIRKVTYGSYSESEPNERTASAFITLTPFTERDPKSPELIDRLEAALVSAVPDSEATVRLIQFDAGPPTEEFAFKTQIYSEDLGKSLPLARTVASLLEDFSFELPSGETARVTKTRIQYDRSVVRSDGKRFIEVQAAYDSDQTSALVVETQNYLESKFTGSVVAEEFGLDGEAVTYDFGQESENAQSFKSLGLVFPIALVLMYVLLGLQFRSLLQPLLIFLAIPFSMFGVTAGLYFTDNPLSFFATVGMVGLVGIAVNNTILLTDYANQERRAGKDLVESIAAASEKRFRPLLATSLTTVVALLPLALSDPFWEALAFTIMFGLLSSTFLVIVSFPYYYLLTEYARTKVQARKFLPWAAGLIAASAVALTIYSSGLLLGAIAVGYVLTTAAWPTLKKLTAN